MLGNLPLKARLVTITGLLTTGALLGADVANADESSFSNFTPLAVSAGPTATEATPITPITFGNPALVQRSIADRTAQLAANKTNSGNWDMNTLNETGRDKGRFLFTVFETGQSGVQRHDLETGTTDTIWQSPTFLGHVAFDASYWTPWGTLLFAEETTGGRLFEAFIDELTGGGIFKFVPDRRGDLSEGQLYAIKAANADGTGAFQWIPLDRNAVKVNARAEAAAKGASGYERPEDVEVIGPNLYVAITGTDRVIQIDLNKNVVTNYVRAGVNVGVETIPTVTGFNNPDNLAQGPDGRLWIVEDNDYSDIFVADSDVDGNGVADAVHLFASLKDTGAEGTGIYFGKDPKTLFVNIQHPDKTLADGTWMITRR